MKSSLLKLSLFATGLSGIVAEYMLSTLATYFLGDSVFQWTMIVSVMLFSMGLGSRLSQWLKGDLLVKFIYIEFTLSIFVSFASLITYTSAGYTIYKGIVIYGLSIIIGILIGLEIPLVIRLNKHFETLRVNISSVLEKDYLGSLVGGVFYAFFGLPVLGLTYTPFLLGFINLAVAVALYLAVKGNIPKTKRYLISGLLSAIVVLWGTGLLYAKPLILHGEQKRYKDKIVFSKQSKYQRIVLTQWEEDYWLYINGNQQLSTLDEVMYHEPLVHPAMQMSQHPVDVLILGGGDGCAVREVLKYPTVQHIALVDLDPEMTHLGATHEILVELNQRAFESEKLTVYHEDAFQFLAEIQDYYDVIIIDLPDPKTVELNRLYTHEFYQHCVNHLRPRGVVVTQAGSPYFAMDAYLCIDKTMQSAGLSTVKLHNQILTLGEWGWVLGTKEIVNDPEILKERCEHMTFEGIKTDWLNQEAMQLMTAFGKHDFFSKSISKIRVNKIHDPVLYQYYLKGNWDIY